MAKKSSASEKSGSTSTAPAPAASAPPSAPKPYVIVRTYRAGVFAGTLESRDGKEATLTNARRIWYWRGAASLSQLAVDGTSAPNECKFPAPAPRVTVTEAIEILDVTEKARASIEAVPPWRQ